MAQWRISEHKTVNTPQKSNWETELECKQVTPHDAKRVLCLRPSFSVVRFIDFLIVFLRFLMLSLCKMSDMEQKKSARVI
jgi:hypothetical protein